jgi:hypothetical protein
VRSAAAKDICRSPLILVAIVGPERARLAPLFPIGAEHEVMDDQLGAPVEPARVVCCANAASGQSAAAPPIIDMNSRRFV